MRYSEVRPHPCVAGTKLNGKSPDGYVHDKEIYQYVVCVAQKN